MDVEIGSFIQLDLRESGEYYQGNKNIARLNSARAGICYSCRLYQCKSIYIPYYLCPTVKKFLFKNGIEVKSYFMDERFEPINIQPENGDAVLIVNYFGILSVNKMRKLANKFKNVIIDNSAAFYCKPIDGCYNVYSPRKFFGVPDGSYVIGNDAEKFTSDYDQDCSSETSSFLLKRIEHGLHSSYKERMENEERIDNSGILRMSRLTLSLLSNIDYFNIGIKRQKNFFLAHILYQKINQIDPVIEIDNEIVPLVYPLVIMKADLNEKLKENRIYTGRWWIHVLKEVPENAFEERLSKYMVPIPIDQRYGNHELFYVYSKIIQHML